MASVVVTGGAGFIGSHLSKKLLHEGHEVICLDNFLTSDRKNIESLLTDEHFTFIEHDVIKAVVSVLEGKKIDYIFHLASPASPNKHSARSYINYPMETLLVNSVGTFNMLHVARKTGAKFLYASTSEVYGDPEESPQKETYFGNVNPNGVRSVYDEAKRFGEAATFAFLRKYSTDTRIIRIFNTYGPHMQKDDGRVVSNFINQALHNKPLTMYGSGDQTRSFCYVDDMVEGMIKALFTDGTKGKVFNLGNPDERTIKDIANIVIRLTKSESHIVHEPLPEDDPKIRQPDISHARAILHWEPKVSLEDGLTKTIAYFTNA